MPAKPRLWLPGLRRYGAPGPVRGPAVADVVSDGVEAEVGGDLRRAQVSFMALGGVSHPGQPVTAQRGLDGVMSQADLGGD